MSAPTRTPPRSGHPRRRRPLGRAGPLQRDGWALIPLRAFLGVTFVYAGLQKVADRWFFKASAPSSLQSQLHAAARTSPIGGLVGPLTHAALLVGLLIAFAELAIGVATLVGLWARAAAGAGLLLSLGFLLTVSWHTSPYYYGADIVFVFAWTPLLVAGAGRWSLDRWAAGEARAQVGLADLQPVHVDFATVQRLCGAYDNGRCRLQKGKRCRPEGCPVLADVPAEPMRHELDRRTFLQQAGVAGWLGSAALLTGGVVAIIGRLVPQRSSPAPTTPTLQPSPSLPTGGTAAPTSAPGQTTVPTAQTPTTSTPGTTAPIPTGTAIGPASAVPMGGAARFTDPTSGDPAYVLQPRAGQFLAFDAVCTHRGCPVDFAGSTFHCPCHGAEFDTSTGRVLRGPATQPLPSIAITEGADGNLYVS